MALATPQAPVSRKTKKQTEWSNQRLTASLNPSNFPVSNTVQGRSFHTRVSADKKHLANWDVLHLDTWNSNGCCNSRSSDMSNSDCSRWKLTEQTMIRVRINFYNIHSAATWRRWHNDKKVWPGQSLVTEYTWRSVAEDDIQEQSPTPENNTHGLEKRMHSCNEATQRSPQRYASPTSKYQFLRDTRDNTAHMVFEGEPAVKLQSKNLEVGTRANGNPIQDQVTMGRVHSRGSANH